MKSKEKITPEEIKRLRNLQEILINISKASGIPNRLRNVLHGFCTRIDRLLDDENSKKRLNTLNAMIDLVTKIIAILQLIK